VFGKRVGDLSRRSPKRARKLLKLGWKAQRVKCRYLPDSRLTPGNQYLAYVMMNFMLAPLKAPENSAMVSICTPCELLQEAGLAPYSVESFSCYLTGSKAEAPFISHAEEIGIAESYCSYHKSFLGAAERGLLPKPSCIVYTSTACDANMLTFKALADFYKVPSFLIDVPMNVSEKSIEFVKKQLFNLEDFICDITDRKVDKDRLTARLERSKRTIESYRKYFRERKNKYIPEDLVSPFYMGVLNSLMLGTEEAERVGKFLLKDLEQAPPKKGKHIYWMHTIPFWSQAMKKCLRFSEDAQIVGDELGLMSHSNFDPADPYDAMARRIVYNSLNGTIDRRIQLGIEDAREAEADGVVWFNHWGCKHTLGGAGLAKKAFEEAGFPTLVLDGDGCSSMHGGEEQTATRLEAFLEMLEN
jgi:benzoyl-CoA reductase/2-hydroxyglutaryl-CoA dehydratase subunit BcrC/BadD/HgdB